MANNENSIKKPSLGENDEMILISPQPSEQKLLICENCATRGPEPKVPRNLQHALFEGRLNDLYDNRQIKSMKELDNFLKLLQKKHQTSKKAAYLVIERFGISHGYIDEKVKPNGPSNTKKMNTVRRMRKKIQKCQCPMEFGYSTYHKLNRSMEISGARAM